MRRDVIPFAVAMLTACTWPASAANRPVRSGAERDPQRSEEKSWHETVLKEAARRGRYVFFFFHRRGSKPSEEMAKVIRKAKRSLKDRADFHFVELSDAARAAAVRRFKVRGEPVTVVVAPGGAVSAYIRGPAPIEALERAIVSPGMAGVLRAIQEQRVVFLCVLGKRSRWAAESLAAAKRMEAALEGIASVVVVDPADQREKDLLLRCGAPTDGKVARIVVIGPGGVVAHRLAGRVSDDDLAAAFSKMLTDGGGCGAKTATGGSTCSPDKGTTGESSCE